MFKIANQILDAYDDPEVEKHASLKDMMVSAGDKQSIPDTEFALSIITKKAEKLNKFPIDSKEHTWLANEYFELNSHKMPKTAAETAAYHIKKACERFWIDPKPSVVGMAKEASTNLYFEEDLESKPVVKFSELDFSKFAQVDQWTDNYTAAQYLMTGPEQVKQACQYFEEHSKEMPLEYRHKYAAQVQRRAVELGMGAQGGQVIKYASDHYSAHLDSHLRSRATLLETAEPKFKVALDKLAGMKKELTPSEFAQVLHGFDKRAKLDRHYGSYLQDPYQATFSQQPDAYAGYRVKVGNADMTADAIKKVATEKREKIAEYFGTSIADELVKNGVETFDALPMDVKEVIVGIADGTL